MFVRREILAFSPFLFFRFSVTQTLMCELPGGRDREIVGEPYPDDSFTMPYQLVWRVRHLIDLFMGEDPSGSTPISGSFFREQNCQRLYMSLCLESVAVQYYSKPSVVRGKNYV